MKHYGDITKINGADVEAVDVICGGSPCQDLSVAGKRAGLAGERSGLFMDQIRIIKEMRNNEIRLHSGRANDAVRCRFMVWENVQGAFSSNNGEDFRAVLEETVRVVDENACVPPIDGGRWPHSGVILGTVDGSEYSIAWRLHDAQFWGVPQRRKRIALVADFGGTSAAEILFERESVSGRVEQGEQTRQGTADDAEERIGTTSTYDVRITSDGTKNCRAHAYETKISRAIDTGGQNPNSNHGGVCVINQTSAISFQERAGKPGGGKGILIQGEHVGALSTLNNQSVCCVQGNAIDRHAVAYKKTSHAKSADDGQGWTETTVNDTLNNFDNGETRTPTPIVKTAVFENHSQDTRFRPLGDICQTVSATYGMGGNNQPLVVREKSKADQQTSEQKAVVRRLTPLECERLQGFPDGWTDIGDWKDSKGKTHKGDSDSPRYKALGNSIALPFWAWMAKRMAAYLPETATMASLFDGIGGFPLVFSHAGVRPVWASEIEEFPIAVTKIRFPEVDE